MLPPTIHYLPIFLLSATIILAAGCTTLSYYGQAVSGQLDILARTRPIEELLDDKPVAGNEPDTTQPLAPAVKARLVTVLRVRDFATQALALPDNDSYRVYADLDRQLPAQSTDAIPGVVDRAQVAWNVVATPEFSLTPKEWCFPVAGCVPYRGYFSHKRAQQFASELRDERLDVRVAGVAAYSTLGWFRDPVFSTQLRRSDTDLAALIFHELAHQKLYLPGDATFNESFATTVEIEGMRRWLAQGSDLAAADKYRLDRTRHAQFVDLLLKFRTRLEALYASPLASETTPGAGTAPGSGEFDHTGETQSKPRRELAERRRAEKARHFQTLRDEYADLRKQWGGYSGYDSWFAQELNNAHLASVGLYHQYVSAFQALLSSVHGDLPAFYRLVQALSRLPTAERVARLTEVDGAQTRRMTIK